MEKTQRCMRCGGAIREDEPGVWLHTHMVGRECIDGTVREVLRPQWVVDWVGCFGDNERFSGTLLQCMAEINRINRSGLLMKNEEIVLTPPVEE